MEAFVNGIRDPDIKLAVYTTQKLSFAEPVSFALTQETARIIAKPQIYKACNEEIVPEEEMTMNRGTEKAVKRYFVEIKAKEN